MLVFFHSQNRQRYGTRKTLVPVGDKSRNLNCPLVSTTTSLKNGVVATFFRKIHRTCHKSSNQGQSFSRYKKRNSERNIQMPQSSSQRMIQQMDGTEVVDGPSLRQSLQTTRLFPLTPFS
jgi:hypothetical protein